MAGNPKKKLNDSAEMWRAARQYLRLRSATGNTEVLDAPQFSDAGSERTREDPDRF